MGDVMNTLEQVEVIDASVRAHETSTADVCGGCALPMASGNVIELTLRSTRPAQVSARLHPVCAVRFLDGASVDLRASAHAG